MSFSKKTIKDIDLNGKRVLVRVDYNVPLDGKGNISDDYRILKSIPTLEYLLKNNCSIVLISHLGRPDGKPNKQYSLEPVAKHLSKLLGTEVEFISDCVGDDVAVRTAALKPEQILMLENVRFHPEEELNDAKFAKELADSSNAKVFVQDCFGVVHRKHASVAAITEYLPSAAGLLLEKEVSTITDVINNPKRPLMAIVGGAKISDKIGIINKLVELADFVAIGGAMANTFLLAEGIRIGKSLADKDDVPLAKEILAKARAKAKKQQFVFYIPQDGVVASRIDKTAKTRIVDWDAHVIASIESYPARPKRITGELKPDEMILDIGPFSGAFIAGGMQLASTVIWNGTMGVAETPALNGPIGPFANGTETIIDAMLGEYGHKPFTVVGGGDTVAYVEDRKLTDCFDHVSTGGGASMELMSGKKLPGVEALLGK